MEQKDGCQGCVLAHKHAPYKLYLPNEGSLAGANQACKQYQLKKYGHKKQGSDCTENSGTAVQALMHKQSKSFGVWLVCEISKPARATKKGPLKRGKFRVAIA